MKIEKLFSILKDGEWHNLTHLSSQIRVQTDKLNEFSKFLSQQGIIVYEAKTHRIKIKSEWQDILSEEPEPTLTQQSSRRKKL